jgi:hypothetical protein
VRWERRKPSKQHSGLERGGLCGGDIACPAALKGEERNDSARDERGQALADQTGPINGRYTRHQTGQISYLSAILLAPRTANEYERQARSITASDGRTIGILRAMEDAPAAG